jgi:hypothetical protein
MTHKIAINGFGRIGRVFLRQMLALKQFANFELVAINDLTDDQNISASPEIRFSARTLSGLGRGQRAWHRGGRSADSDYR